MYTMPSDEFGYWFSGLVDGEGCFTATLSGKPRYIPRLHFDVGLREDDIEVLRSIQRTLGVGSVYRGNPQRNSQGYTSKAKASLKTTRTAENVFLVDLFHRFPLRSKKKEVFDVWAEMIGLIADHEFRGRWTTEKQGLADRLYELLVELRRARQFRPVE